MFRYIQFYIAIIGYSNIKIQLSAVSRLYLTNLVGRESPIHGSSSIPCSIHFACHIDGRDLTTIPISAVFVGFWIHDKLYFCSRKYAVWCG